MVMVKGRDMKHQSDQSEHIVLFVRRGFRETGTKQTGKRGVKYVEK